MDWLSVNNADTKETTWTFLSKIIWVEKISDEITEESYFTENIQGSYPSKFGKNQIRYQ